jgi:hypothetical protein
MGGGDTNTDWWKRLMNYAVEMSSGAHTKFHKDWLRNSKLNRRRGYTDTSKNRDRTILLSLFFFFQNKKSRPIWINSNQMCTSVYSQTEIHFMNSNDGICESHTLLIFRKCKRNICAFRNHASICIPHQVSLKRSNTGRRDRRDS